MTCKEIEQFLDTGWYTEATLFYNGYVYWCEGKANFTTGIITFAVDRWRADCDGELYHTHVTKDGQDVDPSCVFRLEDPDLDVIKQRFLRAPVFEGKTFWDVKDAAIWAEEGAPKHLAE